MGGAPHAEFAFLHPAEGLERSPLAGEPGHNLFALTGDNSVYAQLLQGGARCCGGVRTYRYERSRYIPDGADYLRGDTQFRRRAPPEKIARSRSDNCKIRGE